MIAPCRNAYCHNWLESSVVFAVSTIVLSEPALVGADGASAGDLVRAHSAGQVSAKCICRAIKSDGPMRMVIAVPVARSR